MDLLLLIPTLGTILGTLLVGLYFIRRGIQQRALTLFLVLYLLIQLLAYSFDLDFFKAIVPHGDQGTAWQFVPTTLIPLALSFLAAGLWKRFFKKGSS